MRVKVGCVCVCVCRCKYILFDCRVCYAEEAEGKEAHAQQ